MKGYGKLCKKMVYFLVYHFVWGHLGIWKEVLLTRVVTQQLSDDLLGVEWVLGWEVEEEGDMGGLRWHWGLVNSILLAFYKSWVGVKNVCSFTNAQSRFASVVSVSVLGPPRQDWHKWKRYLKFRKARTRLSHGLLKGALSAQKSFQGSITKMRKLQGRE